MEAGPAPPCPSLSSRTFDRVMVRGGLCTYTGRRFSSKSGKVMSLTFDVTSGFIAIIMTLSGSLGYEASRLIVAGGKHRFRKEVICCPYSRTLFYSAPSTHDLCQTWTVCDGPVKGMIHFIPQTSCTSSDREVGNRFVTPAGTPRLRNHATVDGPYYA